MKSIGWNTRTDKRRKKRRGKQGRIRVSTGP